MEDLILKYGRPLYGAITMVSHHVGVTTIGDHCGRTATMASHDEEAMASTGYYQRATSMLGHCQGVTILLD